MEMTAIGVPSLFFPPLSPSQPATARAAQAVAEKRCVIGWILSHLSAKIKTEKRQNREKPDNSGFSRIPSFMDTIWQGAHGLRGETSLTHIPLRRIGSVLQVFLEINHVAVCNDAVSLEILIDSHLIQADGPRGI